MNTPPIPQAPQQTSKPTDPKEGRYKAKAASPDPTGSPHEFGKSKNGNPELLVHLYLPEIQRTYVTVLYFSKDAAPYSEERLRALGCKDIATLSGIDSNEVDIELKYEWYDGSWRLRVQILSGGGVFHTSNPMQGGGKEFAATLQAMLGRSPLSEVTDNGTPKPPF